jgi:hypothetical protein
LIAKEEVEMSLILAIAIASTGQGKPSMQFKSQTIGQVITVWVYCETDRDWANDRQPIVLRSGATKKLALHTGYFRVVASNQYGVERRSRRLLSPDEIDRMWFTPVLAAPEGRRPPPSFEITNEEPPDLNE